MLGKDGSKTWWATVRATGMLRLPGEDAKVFRNGNPEPQEELSGERGRNLVPGEWQQSQDICAALGLQPDKLLGTDDRRYSSERGQLLKTEVLDHIVTGPWLFC